MHMYTLWTVRGHVHDNGYVQRPINVVRLSFCTTTVREPGSRVQIQNEWSTTFSKTNILSDQWWWVEYHQLGRCGFATTTHRIPKELAE